MSMTPIEKSRAALLAKMTPETQEVAKAFSERFAKNSHDVVLVQYNLGVKIGEMADDEGKYGGDALKHIAEYLDIPNGTTTLYALRGFADAFDKDYVKATMLRTMSNGKSLSLMHWLMLSKLKEIKAREKQVEVVLKESLTANDLEKLLRAGGGGEAKNARSSGRKPKTPSNPLVGLQKSFQLAQQYNRFVTVFDTAVADVIDEFDAEKVGQPLLDRLEKTLETVTETQTKAGEMKVRLTKNIKRVKTILDKKAESTAEEYDEGEEPKKGKKKAKAEEAEAAEEPAAEEEAPKKKKKKKKKKAVAAE